MILAIRSDQSRAELALLSKSGQIIGQLQWNAGRELSRQLLSRINQLLRQHKADLHKLTGLIVFKGPGSFTGLRIGISVANALAYALAIPIVGTNGQQWLSQGVEKLVKTKLGEWVEPDYGAVPRITRPRK